MVLKDLISSISRTYGNAVFPFCNFKDRVLELYQKAYRKGFTNPVCGDIAIEKRGSEYTSIIHLYYKLDKEGKVQKFETEEDYGELEDIPPMIADVLKRDGKVQIKIENITNLLSSRDLTIKKSIKFSDIENIVDDVASRHDLTYTSVTVTLIDELFYTRMVLNYTVHGKTKRYQAAYRAILNYPKDILEQLLDSEDSTVSFEL